MAVAGRPWADDLLHFWFHELTSAQWFARNDEVDARIARRFAALWRAMHVRPAGEFLDNPGVARAAVLLFDQVPRNIFRDDATAFASDSLARRIAKSAIARGWDVALSKAARQFLYMPLMHSEAIADQMLSLRKFASLGDSYVFGFARDHAAMIRRFGRFPHRNALLGRCSTAAEKRAVAAGNAW